MTEDAFDYDYLDVPLTLTDYIEIIGNDLDEAAGNLEEHEIEPLCTAIRNKIGALISEHRRRKPIPAELRGRLLVQKPFSQETLTDPINRAIGQGSAA